MGIGFKSRTCPCKLRTPPIGECIATSGGANSKHNQVKSLKTSTLLMQMKTDFLRTSVMTSFLTLWLCVYTALHLNLPLSSDSRLRKIARKTKWILVGIFAPEVIMYIALMQRISAKKLTRIVNSHLENQVSGNFQYY